MFTKGKMNNAIKGRAKQHTFATANETLPSEDT